MLESLEHRRHFSGTVTVTTNVGPGHLTIITGDAAANEIQLASEFENSMEEEASIDRLYVYSGRLVVDGKEIVGTAGEPLWANVGFYQSDSYVISLGRGDDALRLSSEIENSFGSVEILSGAGDDRVAVDGSFRGDLKINTNTGNDRVSVRSSLYSQEGIFGTGVSGIRGDLNVDTGAGRDRVTLDSDNTFRLDGKLRLTDNSGPTYLGLHAVRARRGASIATGNANDVVSLHTCALGPATRVYTRGGDDIVRRYKLNVGEAEQLIYFLGAGNDRLYWYDTFIVV